MTVVSNKVARIEQLARSVGAYYDPVKREFSILDLEGGVDYEAVLRGLIERALQIEEEI